MRSEILVIIFLATSIVVSGQAPQRNYDSLQAKIVYSSIIEFPGISKQVIAKRVEKFMAVSDYPVRYMDEDELYATGLLQLDYRKNFLIFHNDHDDWYVYDIVISVKENKLRFRCLNFYSIPSHIKIKSQSWFTERNGFGAGWSTTKIPTTTPKRPLEDFSEEKDAMLFNYIDSVMLKFQDTLVRVVSGVGEDW